MLFDIDGTLIRRAGPHHRMALVEAVRRITGIEAGIDHIPVQGMLDRKIMETMLLDAGAKQALVRRSMPRLVEEAQAAYLEICPTDLRRRTCPGVRGFLHRLSRRNVPAGLVTGNLSRIGWRKMELAGLRKHFRFGAFAESAADRAGLVRLALLQAREYGWQGRRESVWLVGDHQNDIRAARANGIRSLAVATGLSSRRELAGENPALLVDDLRGLRMETLFEI